MDRGIYWVLIPPNLLVFCFCTIVAVSTSAPWLFQVTALAQGLAVAFLVLVVELTNLGN